ncbi:uncharacterized protein LOC120334374 [Styela clava]|uniref:uncharacterized protein LOC120334374 isoform X2 n=1 Tax=Styela clava TaxID=7725 RepID=UPI00193A4F85|nr:uncharacterized protein LOC120334374 isoform X2 [Styela clava]
MRIYLLLCIVACAAVCVSGSSREPQCSVQNLPSKRPRSCQKNKWSKCEEKECSLSIEKGILTENGKSKVVAIVKPIKVNGKECDKKHWKGQIKRCSGGIFPCRCRNWGIKTVVTAWIGGKWMSVQKSVEIHIPAGCMCAEQNILTRSL